MDQAPALLLLLAAGFWAGAQNALGGGGSFVTLAALVATGLDAKTANVASTIAMFPGQLASGWAGRRLIAPGAGPSMTMLVAVSLAGGAIGAGLLLLTPTRLFAQIVPWLVLFATLLFALPPRSPGGAGAGTMPPGLAIGLQFAVAVYGGYYSGGIGLLMLAVLGLAGAAIHSASAIKNVLAGVINSAAVLIFLALVAIPPAPTLALGLGALAGGLWGVWILKRIGPRTLRVLIILVGLGLSIALFWRGA